MTRKTKKRKSFVKKNKGKKSLIIESGLSGMRVCVCLVVVSNFVLQDEQYYKAEVRTKQTKTNHTQNKNSP